jgi:uncharacterized protein DUF3489
MMKRAKIATLAEIMEATGWQKHTVRGFVSILGSVGGVKRVARGRLSSCKTASLPRGSSRRLSDCHFHGSARRGRGETPELVPVPHASRGGACRGAGAVHHRPSLEFYSSFGDRVLRPVGPRYEHSCLHQDATTLADGRASLRACRRSGRPLLLIKSSRKEFPNYGAHGR